MKIEWSMLMEMLLWKSGVRKSAQPYSGFLLICPTITLELSAKDLVTDAHRTVCGQVSLRVTCCLAPASLARQSIKHPSRAKPLYC
jgi:hypothetical protein